MPVALICASHSPMMMEAEFAGADVCAAVGKSFADLGEFVKEFDPEYVIQFSPDHFRGFHYDLMPSYCIGAAATACGDWNTREGALKVDEEFSLAVLNATRDAGFDAAISFKMTVDHGFTQMWEQMVGRADLYTCVPIFINCIADPIPAYKRTRLLGDAIGRFASQTNRRVLFAASGGLSHDPIVPRLKGASPQLRNRLINGANLWRAVQPQREIDVRGAALAAIQRTGPAQPLNPDWDKAFLGSLVRGEWDRLDAFTAADVIATAGSGGNEILNWVAATAAMAASGPFQAVHETYVDIPGWIVGMATLAARAGPRA